MRGEGLVKGAFLTTTTTTTTTVSYRIHSHIRRNRQQVADKSPKHRRSTCVFLFAGTHLFFFFLLLLLLLLLLFLLLRSLRNAGYRTRWSERFGRFAGPARTGGIAVHAASLGEVNAASALIAALARHYPDAPLTVTTFTPTGSERVRSVFGETVFHVYAPLDLPGAVRRFFDRVRPRLLVIMETEIWPNLYHEAAARGIPIVIANARIS